MFRACAGRQNFFKAPKMQEWFVKPLSGQLTNDLVNRLSNASTTAIITNQKVAIDFLTWSDQFKPDFDLIRDAVKRPYARMDGSYTDPLAIPIPNSVAVRATAQVFAQRAKCHLLAWSSGKSFGRIDAAE